MDIALCVLALCAGIIGIAGSIIPGLPGPPVSWIGMLLLYFGEGAIRSGHQISLTLLLVMLAVTVLVTVFDYVVPASMTRLTGGSSHASRGAIAGLVAGCVFTPVGMVMGAFLGAFFCELYWGGKNAADSAKAAAGALLGVLTGTGVKLIASGVMMWIILVNV